MKITRKEMRLMVSVAVVVIGAALNWYAPQIVDNGAPAGIPGPETVYPDGVADSTYPVARVVDGDTIAITMNGKSVTVRLIGMNSPEVVDPRKPVECFGKEASAKAHEILDGQEVRIELDPTQGEYDKYGRLLAYVYRASDSLFFEKYMIEEGYAYEYTYDKPYKYQTDLNTAEAYAKANEKGLWVPSACANFSAK